MVHFGQPANGGLIARYATAIRVSHCNKLLSMNLLFLIILKDLQNANYFNNGFVQLQGTSYYKKKQLHILFW